MKRFSWDDVRATLWFWPSVAVLVALGLARVLLAPGTTGSGIAHVVPVGDGSAVVSVLQAVATSVVTALSLTFSLVVVAVQLASQQLSPRLLREFAQDGVLQTALAVLAGTFVYAVTVLLALDTSRRTPVVSVVVGYLLALASVGALVAFLAHIIRKLRVDTMMVRVHASAVRALESFYEPYGSPDVERPGDGLPGPLGGRPLRIDRSGFVRVVDLGAVVNAARDAGCFVRLHLRPGDHVTLGTPIASAWPAEATQVPDDLGPRLLRTFETGYERTLEQDSAYGLRQLADIALKSLSPAVNDPATADHAVGYAGDVLVRLCGRAVGPRLHRDADGVPRLEFPDRDIAYYVREATGQVRRYGGREPTALVSLLRMLRAVAASARDEEQRDVVRQNARLVAAMVEDGLPPEDRDPVDDMRRRVDAALDGDLDAAIVDSSGQTRSM